MQTNITKQVLISVIITVFLFLVFVYLCAKGNFPTTFSEFKNIDLVPIVKYYETHIRGNLFAGLIAVGGFLMTGKTFILVTMKQNVFDDSTYIENYKKMKKFDPKISQYGPLIELKDALYFSVYITIISAIVQMTVGLIPYWVFSLFSIFMAILSIVLVIESLNLIKKNLDYWLNE